MMDIFHRMTDVDTLKCHLCQDFLKLVIIDGWQEKLYNKAKKELSGSFRNSYLPIYNKMRDVGISNYSVEMMDITAISAIINYCQDIAPTSKRTRDALKCITIDKNTISHSGKHEKEEELYLQALLGLCYLKDFVYVVDENESSIENSTRLEFRRKYISKCKELQEVIDSERVLLRKEEIDIQSDIELIKSSQKPIDAWFRIENQYNERAYRIDGNTERYKKFVILASDEGISYAHSLAAIHFLHKKDYAEAERRILMMIQAGDNARSVIDILNLLIDKGASISDEILEKTKKICPAGYKISTNKEGLYELRKIE